MATAAALGGPEAAGDVVEAEFEDLLAVARAAIAWENGATSMREFVEQFLVLWGYEGQEGGSTFFIKNRGVPIDQVGEGLGAIGGLRYSPEYDVFQGCNGF